jgi:hypothetical protein
MNEEPKNIWKKSWRGPSGFLLLFIVLTAAAFVILFCLGSITGITRPIGKLVFFSFLYAVGLALASTLAIAFIRWLCSWRNFKKFLFGCACLATLIALLYAEEDWRGKHDLQKFEREWEAKGEKFNYNDFLPPPVPDDQNFALTPIVYSSYGQMLTRDGKEIPEEKRDKNFVNRLAMPLGRVSDDWPTNSGIWERAMLTDLKPWQDYYRKLAAETNLFPVAPQPQTPAQDVLLALGKYDSTIEELRAASQLPYSRFPIEYGKDDPAAILLPHLAVMKGCAQILRQRAIAELQAGQSEKALADVKLMLYLVQSLRTEPILISHLVRIAVMAIAMQPIYEGLAEHKWSDAQLAELDAELAKMDFVADYEFSMRGERIFGLTETEYLRRTRNLQAMGFDDQGDPSSPPLSNLGFHLAPASFFYWSELTIARMEQQWLLPMADVERHMISPEVVQKINSAAQAELNSISPYKILARMLLPAITSAVKKYARVQSSIDLARVAIALERYRLAHGNYPDMLDALAPQFIAQVPHDLINGQPLHYRLEGDGNFILYSVGWNEKDDGGTFGNEKDFWKNYESGDLVWRYPQK